MYNPITWSAKQRAAHIKQAKSAAFDIIIIGGGITGAGIARDAALRGLSFCLVDKNDFGFGTSSRSSKLAHGGIRYLSYGDFKLVRESTTERNWLRVHFPNLVRPLGFMFNAYEGGKDSPKMIKFAETLYTLLSDCCSKYKNYKKHTFLTPEQSKKLEPKMKTQGHLMSGLYYDTNVDDSRLTLESIKEGLEYSKGASLAINYAKADGMITDKGGKVTGVKVMDELTGTLFNVKGGVVVNATGIWTDEVLKLAGLNKGMIRPTKGVHVIVKNDRIGNNNAFGLRSVDDGRFFFVLRREEISVIGTTDTDYKESLDEPRCYKEDCDYLFNTVNKMFPAAKLTYKDIISTYAGIRPLILEEGKNESAVSRKHLILDHGNGLVTITGGKLTIYRLMAEQLLYMLVEKGYLKPFSGKMSKKGFSKIPFLVGITRENFDKLVKAEGLEACADEQRLAYLHMEYGTQGIDILRVIKKKPALGKALLKEYPYTPAEIEFILEHENAPRLIDIMCRRTEMQLHVSHTQQKELSKKVADIMASFYKWDAKTLKAETKAYTDYVAKTIWF